MEGFFREEGCFYRGGVFLGMRSVWWERYFETLLEMDIFSKNGECIFNEDGGGVLLGRRGI